MNKIQKPSDSEFYPPSSELFRPHIISCMHNKKNCFKINIYCYSPRLCVSLVSFNICTLFMCFNKCPCVQYVYIYCLIYIPPYTDTIAYCVQNVRKAGSNKLSCGISHPCSFTAQRTLQIVLKTLLKFPILIAIEDRLCGLVVRVLGYRSRGPGSIPGTTQPREYN
jgi:hypothetical protein